MPKKYLLLAASVLAVACWNSVGFHQGDEHFQLLEFANYRLGNTPAENLAWEYAAQMRPGTQPFLVFVVLRALGAVGLADPFLVALVLRLLSAGLFLYLAVRVYRNYAPAFADARWLRWLALLLLFSWVNVYSGIRFASENWSGMAFAFGFLLYPLPIRGAYTLTPRPAEAAGLWKVFAAGLLFGCSFVLRYQMALACVGLGAWLIFVGRESPRRLLATVAGGLVVVALGTVADYWLYGEWVNAPWNYLRVNLVEGKAATFGTQPWWGYFESIFERGVPPLSLVYLAAIGWFCYRYRRDPLTWAFVVFFVVHCLLARKDIRFLFPMLPFLPVAIVALARDLHARWGEAAFQRSWRRHATTFLWVLNLLLLASVAVRPMIVEVLAQRYVYYHYNEPLTLLADGKHIYTYSNLLIDFYRRPQGVTIVNQDRAEWPGECPTATCLYSEQTRSPNPPPGAKLVFSTRPAWAEPFNFGGWLDGMRWWYVYELP
ncbi:hypothetical protein QWY85_05965 [Neolewinella lacunae]|uniref:Mannosyltransferase n=1 Tax=Neolewinella lacunae TaxID=1517758 RepID=A0A923PL23_9BACT|nr:hypothetical protein [Neolewinella lacunae]MBC6994505.1 hypothetical protein [Neolewinella lacunae]MDN3634198.1 hypothetical protein [Neolewinella lacunae]